ncbi:hypothetical protein DRN67_02980 [Candidatus Micrarchaeota archaeon]|nr:MAG: hypothetical protein DRN67_02980 [Candidatus Micrarchaeota archaeon]
MVPFGKKLVLRMLLLGVIALCIFVVVTSEDWEIRLLAAVVAIVVEIIRDAILVSGMVSVRQNKGDKN